MVDVLIKFRGVDKRFGAVDVLRGIDFDVARGEHLSLIGPSGSGKTTILRVLMTLERIDGGAVTIDDESLFHEVRNGQVIAARDAHLRKMSRQIGMVFQSFNLFPHMTALANIAKPLVLSGGVSSKGEAEERGRELMAMVGLADKADTYPSQLSGGQKQRVAIARALAMQPNIILFDEVTSSLDPELVEEVQNVIRDVSQHNDATMIFVTHEMSFAREISDRVMFLDEGRIIETGPPARIFSTPRQERTRLFLRKIIAAGLRI